MSWRGCGFKVAMAAMLVMLGACTASIDVDKEKVGQRPGSCIKGAVNECPCPDGTDSQQVCNAMGRFDVCQCADDDDFGSAGNGG